MKLSMLSRAWQGSILSNLYRRNTYFSTNQLPNLSTASTVNFSDFLKMKTWQLHSYEEDLQLTSTRTPLLNFVDSILVNVDSVSVNPIDLYMKDGYARNVLNVLREDEMELPLTLGRDFAGTIVRKGLKVDKKYKVGDKVYGFIPLHKQGSFADYVLAESGHFQHQPNHLNPAECAAIVYAAMTAWSALFITGGLERGNSKDKRVLILGASGGVGTMAVQLLKSQGVHVSGACATDAIALVRSLGADEIYDYSQSEYTKEISKNKYDIILDCAKFGIEKIPNDWRFKQFITLNSPLMLNTDQYGLLGGSMKSLSSLLAQNIINLKNGRVVKWGFFLPCSRGFEFINSLVKCGMMRPVIHKEYSFAHLPDALNEVKKGHLRGKDIFQSFIVLIAYTQVLHARTQFGLNNTPDVLTNFREKLENEFSPLVTERLNIAIRKKQPNAGNNILESELSNNSINEEIKNYSDKTWESLPLIRENEEMKSEIYLALSKPRTDATDEGRRDVVPSSQEIKVESKINQEKKAEIVETGPEMFHVIQELEPEKVKVSADFFSLMPLKEELTAPPVLQKNETPARVETIPKNEVMKSQQTSENTQFTMKDFAHVFDQDPLPPIPANKVEESTSLLQHCIEMLRNNSYYPTPLSIIKEVPAHVHDPLPPLPSAIAEVLTANSSEKSPQHVSEMHEPLPPLSNHIYETLVPIKSTPDVLYPPTTKDVSIQDTLPPLGAPNVEVPSETALPITEGSYYPAAVVPSGPYPAAVSVLKEVPVVQVAEPLPPLQKITYTNVELPKDPKLQAPKGPYPANLPIGSPYPPTV